MGFFKNIGKSIKKNVNLKGVLKIATPIAGMVPYFGGMAQNILQGVQDKAVAKKAEQAAQNEYDRQVAEQQQLQAQSQVNQNLGQMAKIASQSTAYVVGDALMQGVNDGLGTGFVNGSGQVGATVVTSTIKVWFQRNWKYVLGGLAGLIGLIYLVRSGGSNGSRRVTKRR